MFLSSGGVECHFATASCRLTTQLSSQGRLQDVEARKTAAAVSYSRWLAQAFKVPDRFEAARLTCLRNLTRAATLRTPPARNASVFSTARFFALALAFREPSEGLIRALNRQSLRREKGRPRLRTEQAMSRTKFSLSLCVTQLITCPRPLSPAAHRRRSPPAARRTQLPGVLAKVDIFKDDADLPIAQPATEE
jgi:hypothetical protein